uniref:Uncharacterized protein n=1 Tax=Chromera velia CCMP2878 TaxID=1169474 RepID=A0A0G4H8B7_9ALVE|eukprot:Cvel_5854.t1-p1 / transcript=Cvel_5854.t1 / gene=Cvel_5854 / organism=Chromera_velia_CCMP2878 / gene_product=hypothetical protein / transcript_product=hypothetical protein / location=Cvel_scaffold278:56821-63661(+) / protein_length=233 / sequence_SO=supercontig / SO=protein_coding / is_pseudo=false
MTIIQLHDIVMARFKESGEASYSQWREKYVDKAIAPPNKIPKRDALKETVGGEEKPPLVSPDYVSQWSTERFYNQNFQTRFAAKGPMWWDKATERVPETAGWREAVKAVVEKIGVASSKFEDMREDIIKSTTVYWGKNKPPAITAEEVVNMSEKVITVAEQITTALNELVNGSEMKAVKKGERAGEGEKGAGVTRMSRGAIRLVVRKFNDKLIPAAMELKKDVNNYVPYTGGA